MEKSGTPNKQVRRPLRTFRPIFWWIILVLVLYGIRTHQRLMEETRLVFTVTMQGQPHYHASTSFDGKPINSGQNISLGNHTFVVTGPKGEPFSTNMFVWYGEHKTIARGAAGLLDYSVSRNVIATHFLCWGARPSRSPSLASRRRVFFSATVFAKPL